ncbi:hypothetical protein HYS54_03105 [Candidatus Micrarchaeota archaeon]|nr:hypothetical protein [Candidatus Micrarchaeota archaeon]
MLLGELRFCAKYPFSQQARQLLRKLDVSSVADDLLAQSAKRVEASLRRADFAAKLNEIVSSQETFLLNETFSFPLSKMIISLSKDGFMLKQFARAEAERAKYFLKFEPDETIRELSSQFFKLSAEGSEHVVPLTDFLRLMPKDSKLATQSLSKGNVSVTRDALESMISEAVFQSITSTRVDENSVPKIFTFWANELKKFRKTAEPDLPLGDFDMHAAPPCMRRILSDLQSSEKVGHMPRFALATFCANTHIPIDTAIDFFRKQPNWNEQKTRYHLEHAYGLKSSRVKYSCPNCVKMESLGLCFRDETCKWPNPAMYYKRMMARKLAAKPAAK